MPRTFELEKAKWFPEGSLPEVPLLFSQADIIEWAVKVKKCQNIISNLKNLQYIYPTLTEQKHYA